MYFCNSFNQNLLVTVEKSCFRKGIWYPLNWAWLKKTWKVQENNNSSSLLHRAENFPKEEIWKKRNMSANNLLAFNRREKTICLIATSETLSIIFKQLNNSLLPWSVLFPSYLSGSKQRLKICPPVSFSMSIWTYAWTTVMLVFVLNRNEILPCNLLFPINIVDISWRKLKPIHSFWH